MSSAKCPTCGYTNDDDRSMYCSNVWHLTGEDRIPQPTPFVLPGGCGGEPTMSPTDEFLERVDDAIEDALLAHEPLDNDSRCSCGARNNMDGDVLHSHRLGAVSAAVREVLVGNQP